MASSSLPPSLQVFAQSYLLNEARPDRLISYWNLSRTLTLTLTPRLLTWPDSF